MNFRLTAILFFVTTICVTGLLLSVLLDDSPSQDSALLDALAGSKEEDIDAIELARTEPVEQKLVFLRSGSNKWELAEPYRAKIDPFPVNGLVRDLLRLKPTPFANLSRNLSIHGLEKPTLKITLRSGTTKSVTLNIGDTTIGNDKAVTFVTTSARPNTPIAVKRSDLSSLFRPDTKDGKGWAIAKWLTDFRDRRLLGSEVRDAITDLEKVTLKHDGKEVVMQRTASGDWQFTQPTGYGLADVSGAPDTPTDTYTGVRPLLNTLTGFQVFDPADFIENPQPLENYGLKPDDPKLLQIELTPRSGKPEVLHIGKVVDEKATPIKYYAKLQSDSAVVRLQTDRIAPLMKIIKDPVDLRDRTIVSDLKRDSIDAIDVTTPKGVVKLRKVSVGAAKQWLLYGGPNDPQGTSQAVQTLIDTITKPRAASDILAAPYDAVFAEGEVKVKVNLWFDGLEAPATPTEAGKLPAEPKLKGDGKPSLTLQFGKQVADIVYLRRANAEGISSDLKVSEAIFKSVDKSRVDFIDLKLKSFATNNVSRLQFLRNGETYELVKDEKANILFPTGKWTYEKPENLKGQIADASRVNDELLGLLATQSASKIVTEQPTPEQLKQWGLDPAAPRSRATITLATGEPKEIAFLFGNEAEDRASVYTQEVGKPLVFLVNKVVAENLSSLNLRDRVLYRLDPAKIQKIRLRGWKEALKQPGVVELEKKEGKWTLVASPSAFTLDPGRVDQLLSAIVAPRAVKFVPGQTPEQGFDMNVAPNTLEVLITAEGMPPVSLTIGNEADMGLNYFAWATGLQPTEVSTLPAALIRPFKEKPEALAKP